MEALYDLSWRAYPAAAIALAGVWLCVRGLRRGSEGRRAVATLKGGTFMTSIRLLIAGCCLVAFAAGWTWQQLWLVIIALVVFGEEMFETTMALAALRESERLRAQLARRKSQPVA